MLSALRSLWNRAGGRFARQPSWRAFVSAEVYYSPYLRPDTQRALIKHTGPYVAAAPQQLELINGMLAGRGPAVVWAPPGCGKSRFALELARRIERERGWQVFFVHHDEAVAREEVPNLLRLKHLVLIVDDAHECPDLVQILATACAQAEPTAPRHLVCVTRGTGRASVIRAINGVYPPGLVQELDLGRPAPENVRTLIERLLPKSSPHHRDTIARFVRRSYFGAVLVCTLLSSARKLPQTFQRQDLHDRICREPLREAIEGLCNVETALRVLAVYAARSPVPNVSPETCDLAAELSSLAASKVQTLIERVLAAGLFQHCGEGLIRPVPDLLGDLILEEACLDTHGKPTVFSGQMLERLFEVDTDRTLANCADIGQLFGSPTDVDLVSAWMVLRAQAIPIESRWDVTKLLETCRPLTVRRPGTVLDVIGILEKRGVLRRNPPAEKLHGSDSIEMNSCALLMQAGEVDASIVPVAFRWGRDLLTAARADGRSLEQVYKLLKDYCKFQMGRGVTHAQAVVNTLRTWASESDREAAALAATLAGQFLTLEVEGHEATLSPIPAVQEVRDVAVDSVVRGVAHPDVVVQCAAITALERYASAQLAPESKPLLSWLPQLTREVQALSTAVIQRVKSTEALPLYAAAEQQGWLWWAQPLDLLHQAGNNILRAIPDSDAYRLWKAVHSQRLPVFTAIPGQASSAKARQEFFQASSTVTADQWTATARRLFEDLNDRHPTAVAWRELWQTVFTQTPRSRLQHQADAVLSEFIRQHPDAAWSLLDEAESDSLTTLLPFLLAELGKHDRARRSQLIGQVRPGTRLEGALLHALSSAAEPDEAERSLLARGLESTDPDTVYRAAAAMLTTRPAERLGAFQAVFGAITRNPNDSGLWQLAIERFARWGQGVLPPRGAGPDEALKVDDALEAVAADLMQLLRTQTSQLRWGYQPHTQELATALAIFALAQPQQLQEWIRSTWGEGKRTEGTWDDASPLSVRRLTEALRLIKKSPETTHWIHTFAEWMKHTPRLGGAAALWLAELCSLESEVVGDLAKQIAEQPTAAALEAFVTFMQQKTTDRAFPEKALALLDMWSQHPSSYAPIENAVIHALVRAGGGRRRGQPSPTYLQALAAIELVRARNPSAGLLSASLDRAEREIREAIEQQRARDEEQELMD